MSRKVSLQGLTGEEGGGILSTATAWHSVAQRLGKPPVGAKSAEDLAQKAVAIKYVAEIWLTVHASMLESWGQTAERTARNCIEGIPVVQLV